MMTPVTLTFSFLEVRATLFAVLLEQMHVRSFCQTLGIMAATAILLGGFNVISIGSVWSALAGLGIAVIFGAIYFLFLYCVNFRFGMQALQSIQARTVTYTFSEDKLSVSASNWSQEFAWQAFTHVARYPLVLLLEVRESRSKKEIMRAFNSIVSHMKDVAELREQSAGFPVIWLQPAPLKRYLVLTTRKLTREDILSISTWVTKSNAG